MRQLLKYCLVGGLNTLVCAVVIYVLMYRGFSLYVSNVAGYGVGVIFSYILNSIFTFQKKMDLPTSIKFLASVFIAYLCNVLVIYIAIRLLPNYDYLVQLIGMVVYTIIGFIINKIWVMK